MSSKKNITTIGIIGIGRQGSIHYNVLCNLEQENKVKIVGVCDVNTYLYSKIKHPFYTDYKKMLSETRPKLVLICVPNYLHYRITMYSLDLKINVIKEKPLAINLDDATKIIDKATRNKLIVATMQQREYQSLFIKAKQVIKSLGIPINLYYQISVDDHKKSWYWDIEKAGGGSWLNIGWHSIAILQWLLGKVSDINLVSNANGKRAWSYLTDHSSLATLIFNKKYSGVVFVSCVYPKKEVLKINFNEGQLILTKKLLKIRTKNYNKTFILKQKESIVYKKQMEALLYQIKNGSYNMNKDLSVMSIIQKGSNYLLKNSRNIKRLFNEDPFNFHKI